MGSEAGLFRLETDRRDHLRLGDEKIRAAFDGRWSTMSLREGFGLHTLDAVARHDFETTAIRQPGIVLHCFLEGSTEATLSDEPLKLGRERGTPVRMVLTAVDEPEPFRRRARPGEYVRKANIVLSHDWLSDNGLALPPPNGSGRRVRLDWDAAPDDVLAMERLVEIAGSAARLHRLEAESIALGTVCRAFEVIGGRCGRSAIHPHDRRRMVRMEQFIRDGDGDLPGLAEIADIGGVSLSTMRRLFRKTHGCTVLEFVRTQRLSRARRALERNGVSVAEAARLAGYRSPENFATAFRKSMGIAPSELRRRSG